LVTPVNTKKVRPWLINAAFAALAVVSLYFAFKGKDLAATWEELKKANYFWALPVLLSSLVGSASRALRWQQLLEPVGHKPSFAQSFFPLMYGYFVNIGTPRLGEVTRCVSLQNSTGIPFAKSFGTVFTERAIDMVCLLLVVSAAFIMQVDLLGNFFAENIYSPVNEKTGGNAFTVFIGLVIAGICGLLVLLLVLRKLKKSGSKNKLLLFVRQIIEGLLSIFRLKKPLLFLLYTAVIWFSYFLTSYLWFFAFPSTQNLTVAAAFTVMSVGAVAKSLPVQASGAGVYHVLISQLLTIYTITGVSTLAYATLNHGAQLIYNIILGIIALAWLFTHNQKSRESETW